MRDSSREARKVLVVASQLQLPIWGEPLCLDKLGLAAPQGILGPLALRHIDIDADHPRMTIAVIGNMRAGFDPPQAVPRKIDAVVDIVFALLLTKDLLAHLIRPLDILGVSDGLPLAAGDP
jgi:hypothetical protein